MVDIRDVAQFFLLNWTGRGNEDAEAHSLVPFPSRVSTARISKS